ncbi:MAG TPA: adenylosuccinate synthase [Nitrospiraceae bacterium]|nr:adenylosuccinate synthase [Nitrospiraceae bacterium]
MANKKTKPKPKAIAAKARPKNTPAKNVAGGLAKKQAEIQAQKQSATGLVIVGSQWGDEGKGKIVDVLSERVDLVVRYQGGNNAGHTVVVGEKKFKLHTLPSGVVRGKRSLVGAGVVVDPRDLMKELLDLEKGGVKVDEKVLGIDARCQVIMPWHNLLDSIGEARAEGAGRKIGTTGRGIGPAYEDRAGRRGIRFEDFLDEAQMKGKIRKLCEEKISIARALGVSDSEIRFSSESVVQEYAVLSRMFAKYLCDASSEVNSAVSAGKRVLFEGAQGTLLDNDFGTYPFVTSSHPIAGAACTGIGTPASSITRVEAIVKAYTTRVGEGPFPTELKDSLGEALRQKGGEFGATTGRPRRCGWLDILILKHAIRINGLTGLAITKLDILDGFDKLKICVGYKYKGKRYTEFPKEIDVLNNCTPVYETVEGWKESTLGIKDFNRLPANAKKYIRTIEKMLDIKVHIISTGQKRDEIIVLKEQF